VIVWAPGSQVSVVDRWCCLVLTFSIVNGQLCFYNYSENIISYLLYCIQTPRKYLQKTSYDLENTFRKSPITLSFGRFFSGPHKANERWTVDTHEKSRKRCVLKVVGNFVEGVKMKNIFLVRLQV
jgi:hypothetical protein